MKLFNQLAPPQRQVSGAQQLEKYLDSTNGRSIRGQFTRFAVNTVLDDAGEIAYEDKFFVTHDGDFIKVPSAGNGEPDQILFVRQDLGEMEFTGKHPEPILVASAGQLMVDAAALTVRARREV